MNLWCALLHSVFLRLPLVFSFVLVGTCVFPVGDVSVVLATFWLGKGFFLTPEVVKPCDRFGSVFWKWAL